MRSTFSILFFIKKNELKKNGLTTIMIRITVNGKQIQFSSNLQVNPESWDQKSGKVRGRSSFSKELNSQIEIIRTTLYKHYIRLISDCEEITPNKIKAAFLSSGNETTLIYQFEKHNELYQSMTGSQVTYKTYSRYELTKNRLIEFMEHEYEVRDIQLNKITVSFIEKFYLYIQSQYHCSNNTTMKFIQRFRAVMNFVENSGLLQKNPFFFYKIRFQKTSRTYLNMEEINKIWQKEFSTKRLEQVRDVFIFSCYTGLSFIDICNLREENIQLAFDNKYWVIINRQKNNNPSHIPLLKIPLQIIKKYKRQLSDGKIFPISSNQKMNEYLKEIMAICGIEKNVTFHTARHSFSTSVTLGNGVPIETISQMLGHNNIKTTQIYAKITDLKISMDMKSLDKKLAKSTAKRV
ncbi:MAG: site-specific integrase [Dysgonamonadaceae bacterium]|jgi:site-specific recombinase XerD|nr:site-specific integrase [Dysgonamonadaceae bacterium]